jgi:hypothetical protein
MVINQLVYRLLWLKSVGWSGAVNGLSGIANKVTGGSFRL